MEVIFIKDLKNQGKKGQIKTVKDGYAENYLIKNGYAVKKTKENLTKLNNELARKEKQDEENKKKALKVKETIAKETLEFKVKTGEGDKVFGSISVKQIKDELQKKGYEIEKSQIEIQNTIQSLGFHNVIIHLYPEVDAEVKVHVIK
ncbi:MAG: 50S ribosomal protein L9 [Bacilli bacterium]|nr:50S ribosomal protein L9 [Bacilli bacterium]